MPVLPSLRPPPGSTLSLKRAALSEVDGALGRFETMLVPRLFAEGAIVADHRIVVDHHQDHGALWSAVNGFHAARSSYGYHGAQLRRPDRLRQASWSILHWPGRMFADAHRATRGGPPDRAGAPRDSGLKSPAYFSNARWYS